MKHLYIALLALLVCGQSVYGMKRVKPLASVKNRIAHQLKEGNVAGAQKTYQMYKGVFPHFSLNSEKKASHHEVKTLNKELVNDSFSILRSNFCWLLPASAIVLAVAQTPLTIGLGVIGTIVGSFGFKKQCDYFANSLLHTEACKNAEILETITEKEKPELK